MVPQEIFLGLAYICFLIVYHKKQSCFTEVVEENRKSIQQSLITAAMEPYEASFRISYIDDLLVLEPSDQTLNSIISPIACTVVVVMTVIILSLEARK